MSRKRKEREIESDDDKGYPPASEINESNSYSKEYDLIININSIRFLNKPGWKMEFFERTNFNKDAIRKAVENSKMTIVSVLGNSNRGKTHLLQKISDVNLKSGYQIQTKGLSIKINEKEDIILLDTAGTNAPLLVEDKNNPKWPEQKEIDYIQSCQIITNHILQSFIIDQAHIFICVIGMLTASEQSFLNKIKKFSKNKKKLIVIHNLIKCTKLEEIIKYKDEVLNKMISVNLEEREIPNFDKDKILFNKYYIEKDDEDIMHFIYCNDDNKSEDLSYYNKSTLNFIKKCVKIEVVKPINIIQNLKEHIKELSSLVLKEEIKSLEEENDVIMCKNEIKPKDILYDGGDDIIFIGKEFEPKYRYYVDDDSLIIEIEICSKYNDLQVKKKFDKISKETLFIITGERIIDDDDKNYEIFNFGNKRENYKKFKLQLSIKLRAIGLHHLDKEYKQEMKCGILFLKFKDNK